ncbi:MAG: DUF3833 domain-containing protein [Pseudomonadota bacterium]
MQPTLTMEEYFNGPIKAWGIIQSRRGKILSRFDVDLVGRWEGDTGTLEERFVFYKNGDVQNRTWEITKLDDRHYQGKAGDIIGIAKGDAYGNALRWSYQMDVPVGDKTYRLMFDDWLWAMNDGVVINRSYLKKFGITVAEITIFMQKESSS